MFFTACENPIMERWWEESGVPISETGESDYIMVMKMIPQTTFEVLIEHEIVYMTIIESLPPEIIIEYLLIFEVIPMNLPELVVEIIEVVREMTPEELYIYITENITEEIIRLIIEHLTEEQIREIIKEQPPSVVLQTISIMAIEYVIFAGDSYEFNGNSPNPGGTNLTAAERRANDTTMAAMVNALADNPDYLMILHGHANSTTDDPLIIAELMVLSENRALAVENILRNRFREISATDLEKERVSTSGYGGEKNLSGANSAYAPLNRRVEMILIRVN
jgi:hypothetical protein